MMFEYVPLIIFQSVFAASGLAVLYRIVSGPDLSFQSARVRRDEHKRSA